MSLPLGTRCNWPRAPDDEVARALEGALSLFSGPLLPGFDDGWFALHARRLGDEFAGAACRLAELSPPKALPFLRRAREFVPAREDVARALLRVLAQSGQLDEARQQWHELEATLRRDWNRTPTSETRRLADSLFKESAAPKVRVEAKGLPSSPNRFFGRERELVLLSSWLREGSESARLVTLWAGGGGGKTRLAIEAARQFEGEAFFVPLGSASNASLLWEALAGALQVARAEGKQTREWVIESLGRKRVLLVLDCFEHLLEDGPTEVKRLLDGAPRAVLLVTSRRELGLEGERLLALSPLPLPGEDENALAVRLDAASLDEWARNPAVRLFFDRARAASPGFRLHAGNARDVVRVCRALEGVPLAIELAAARTLALSPAQVAEHLGQKLDFLKRQNALSGASNEARHTSLRAALDWSFELLSPDARSTLQRLSVFRGGWTLPAATKVCALRDTPQAARRTLEAHEELRRHALLDGEETGGEMRFRLPDTVREYALEQARSHQGARASRALSRRHALEFARLAESFAQAGRGGEGDAWFARLERELPDLREAFDWALGHDGALALRLAGCLWWFWFGSSRLEEGRAALARALETPVVAGAQSNEPNWRAEALSGAGFLAWRQGDMNAANVHSTQALELARAGGQNQSQSYALIYSLLVLLLVALLKMDVETANALGDECLNLSRARGDQHGQAFALHLLGGLAETTGDARTAWMRQEQSATLFEATGSVQGQAWALFNWSIAARRLGDFERALALCDSSRVLFEKLGSREGAAYCDLHTGLALERRARVEQNAASLSRASELLVRALNEFWRLKASWGVALALEGCAQATHGRDAARSARAWSAARKIREDIGAPVPPADEQDFAAFEAELRALLGELSFEAQWEMGRQLTLEQIVRDANRNR